MLISGLFGGIVGGTVGAIIDLVSVEEDRIREDVRNSNALYGKIKELQPKTLKVDQIDKMGDVIKQTEYHTQETISNDLYVGQRIYA